MRFFNKKEVMPIRFYDLARYNSNKDKIVYKKEYIKKMEKLQEEYSEWLKKEEKLK